MNTPREARRGFTLVEMLIVAVVAGILAGLAMPNLREAVFRAEAAKVASDVHTVELAVRTYMEDNGAVPRSGRWGQSPPGLSEYLPEGFPFQYKTLTYRVVGQVNRGRVRLEVRYTRDDPLGVALQRLRSDDVTWTKTKTTFWFER